MPASAANESRAGNIYLTVMLLGFFRNIDCMNIVNFFIVIH